MSDVSIEEARQYSGYLYKKSPKLFVGYQNRLFKIIDGKLLTYYEKGSDVVKGVVNIEKIHDIITTNNTDFSVKYEERSFDLRAENDEEKQRWIKVLFMLREELRNSIDYDLNEVKNTKSNSKSHKVDKIDKNVLTIMKSHGLNTGQNHDDLSQKCLELKGIKDSLNLNDPKIKSRIHYGILVKNSNGNGKKRWFFLISSRPLRDEEYAFDDYLLEKNKLPSFLQFDVLYYYKCENDIDERPPKKEFMIGESHAISRENNNAYEIHVDMGDRKFIFESSIKGDRDLWFEVLVNCRKTAKEIMNSKTGKPRNVNRLQNIMENEGLGKIREICESDKNKCILETDM